MLRKRDSIFLKQRFTVICFTATHYDTFAVARDHMIGHLVRLSRAFRTCTSESRNMHMLRYGIMWHRLAHSQTRVCTLAVHFDDDKCYCI